MAETNYKEQLLKLASDIREIAVTLQEQEKLASGSMREKTASQSQDFSLGAVGGPKKSMDPLMEFIFS